jgi:hypothetical protein
VAGAGLDRSNVVVLPTDVDESQKSVDVASGFVASAYWKDDSMVKNELGLLCRSLPLAAMAGGMAWGIRGQYGHETGAMIFGVLVGLVIVLMFLPQATALQGARAIGLLTLAIGFGGSMTYGQTIGLTMDASIHGNVTDPHWNAAAYRWGMIGLAIKGGLWIGFGGLFLGIGLSDRKVSPLEMLGIGIALTVLFFVGCWLLNTPFDPPNKQLPYFYFSDHWRWEDASNVKPRREVWGGLLFAFAGLMGYFGAIKRDPLPILLGLWGGIGGLGFPIGQSLQAAEVWDSGTFAQGVGWRIGVNSWNMMEVTFGMIAGFCLCLGCWIHRHRICRFATDVDVPMSPAFEGWLIGFYVYVLLVGWYFENSVFVLVHEIGVLMGLLPMVVMVGARYAPFLYILPIVAISIVVKTYLARFQQADFQTTSLGLVFLVTLPLAVLIWLALYLARRGCDPGTARWAAGLGLAVTASLYFWLNFTFFSFPWDWFRDWQGLLAQKHSGGIYVIGWLTLMISGLAGCLPKRRSEGESDGSAHP